MPSAGPGPVDDTVIATLETDAQSARRIADLFGEAVAIDQAAVSLVDAGRGQWRVIFYFRFPVDRQTVRDLVVASGIERPALRFDRVAAKDWVRENLAGLRPVGAGRFIVHGAHDRARIPANRIGIEIEAALAFGTGHHGTTRGCLLALDAMCKRLSSSSALRILDLGAGSGVLAIAAARALRARVLATDLDPEAVRIARANARLNGAGALIEVAKADGVAGRRMRARAPFDLVFANILLGPLQRFAAPLTRLTAPGARVILSGLLPSQANAAIAAYRGLSLERRIELDGWTTLVLARRRRPSGDIARRRAHP
jgi:ribosomal protein L11 methyltransferase